MRTAAVLFASALAFTTYSLYASASDNLPQGWTLQGEAPQLYSASVDHEDSPSGKGSLVLQRTESSHPYGSAHLLYTLRSEDYAGKRIRVSMRIRSRGVDGINAGIVVRDNHGLHSEVMGEHDSWAPRTKEIDLPRDTRNLAVGITLKGPGTIKADELEIVVLGDAPDELRARRMESIR